MITAFLVQCSWSFRSDNPHRNQISDCIRFIINVKTEPEGAFFKIKGKIFVRGPQGVVKKWVAPEGDRPPRICLFLPLSFMLFVFV